MPSNLRPDHRQCVVSGAISRVPMKTDDRNWSMHEQAFETFSAPVTLTLAHDLHIRTWPIFCEYILGAQILTSNVKAFKSYRLSDSYIHRVPEKNVNFFICQITLSKINRLLLIIFVMLLSDVKSYNLTWKLADFNDFWCVKSWQNLTSIACTFAHLTCTL